MDTIIGQYLTADQAAEQLGISKVSLYRLCSSRRIRHRRAGKKFLFEKADLEAYLESTVVEPKARPESKVQLKHLRA